MLSIAYLDKIRTAEIEKVIGFLNPGARILEIGAGTGKQALELKRHGYDVVAIEIGSSNYAEIRVFPIIDYDGRHIPLPDASIDIVFSSNVLEHVPDLGQMHSEILRVLKPDGYCVHVLPTHAWRGWTTVSSYPEAIVGLLVALPQLVPHKWLTRGEISRLGAAWYRAARYVGGRLLPRRHGERGNVISEIWLFHPRWWRRNFREHGFTVVHDEPMGLFYTGNVLFGTYMGLACRANLARALGSACHLYKLARH